MLVMPAAAVLRYEELCQKFLVQQIEEVLRFPLELTTYQVGYSTGSPASPAWFSSLQAAPHVP